MAEIKEIGIFCASNYGINPLYKKKSEKLVDKISELGMSIVYGGSDVGIMKIIADRAAQNNTHLTGVFPESMKNVGAPNKNINKLILVKNLFERKEQMVTLSDAFVILPGGIGTFDELFEVVALLQLKKIDKPIAIFNVLGYYNKLIDFLKFTVEQKFVKESTLQNIIISDNVDTLFNEILNKNN